MYSFSFYSSSREIHNVISDSLGVNDSFYLDLEYNLFFKDFVYLFLDKGEWKEKERERNISLWLPLMRPLLGTWPTTQACALTGN